MMERSHIDPALDTEYSPSAKLKDGVEGEVYTDGRKEVVCQREKVNVYFKIVKDNLGESVPRFIQNELIYGKTSFITNLLLKLESLTLEHVEMMDDYDE